MLPYDRITFIENRIRKSKLERFHTNVRWWFETVVFCWPLDFSAFTKETGESKKFRSAINRSMQESRLIVAFSYVSDEIFYTPPQATWWIQWNINLIPNMYALSRYKIPNEHVTDIIESSIWVYDADLMNSIIRSFNPFYWVSRFSHCVAASFIKFLSIFWFWNDDGEKSSKAVWIMSSIFSVIFWLVSLVSWVATILSKWNIQEITSWLKGFLS